MSLPFPKPAKRRRRILIDPADRIFSEYIRRRDGRCVSCGKQGQGRHGIVGLDCAHYFGRSKESVRFDPENADALCKTCHWLWDHTRKGRLAHELFKVRQLGHWRHGQLEGRSRHVVKRDRAAALMAARSLLGLL